MIPFYRSEIRGEYADVIERCLYNVIPAAISFEGDRFLYVNPLEIWPPVLESDPDFASVKPVRQQWYQTACCPPNLARFLPAIGGYLYTVGDQELLLIHLYMTNHAILAWHNMPIELDMAGDYPWEDQIDITLHLPSPVQGTIALRIPSWSSRTCLSVNGQNVSADVRNGYAYLCRYWQPSDTITIVFDMTPRIMAAHPRLMADAGKVAVMRGPVLYCAEEVDSGPFLFQLRLLPEKGFESVPMIIKGRKMLALRAHGTQMQSDAPPNEALYRPYTYEEMPRDLLLIPYYAWGNRANHQPQEMRVWLMV